MRHAIVGAGFGAGVHLPAFAAIPDVEVVAVADNGSGRSKSTNISGVANYSDWRHMLDAVRPDSLSVVVPPSAQRVIVEEALHRRIHVFCEKPLGLDVAEAQSLRNLASTAGVVNAVGLQYRFEPGMPALRAAIQAVRVGEIRRIDLTWITAGRAQPQRQWTWQHDSSLGGGVLKAFMPHVVDLWMWLSGHSITSVNARCKVLIPERPDSNGVQRTVTGEDMVDARCEMSNDAVATARVTNCQEGGDGMRVEVLGAEGTLGYEHRPPFLGDAQLTLCLSGGRREILATGERTTSDVDPRIRAVHQLARTFVESARAGRSVTSELLPTFEHGYRIQQLLAAMQRSAALGQAVSV